MLIANPIIRDIVLSELTNEPYNSDSQEILDYFDHIFKDLTIEKVDESHSVWVNSEGLWLVNYYLESKRVSIHNDFYNYIIISLYKYTKDMDSNGIDQLFLYMIERKLGVEVVLIHTKTEEKNFNLYTKNYVYNTKTTIIKKNKEIIRL
jgi:hypothetical protein